tara:strand:- start:232 stop:516 length:285 start_codon:yes stop_codon:yes gene_type:complete
MSRDIFFTARAPNLGALKALALESTRSNTESVKYMAKSRFSKRPGKFLMAVDFVFCDQIGACRNRRSIRFRAFRAFSMTKWNHWPQLLGVRGSL